MFNTMGWILLCLLLLLMTQNIQGQLYADTHSGSCTSFQDRTGSRCIVTITCNGFLRYRDSTFSSISCFNNYYGYRNYDGTYDLILDFMNMNQDEFSGHQLLPHYLPRNRVKEVKFNYFKTVSMQRELVSFDEITHFEITHGALETIDLSMFGNKHSLVSINASFNRISILEDESVSSSSSHSLEIIDLSNNLIQALPNNYFFRFPNLLHLNLSHNYIKNFDILTFEGLSHLQTLYLSNNMLESIGHSFVRFGNLQELMLDYNQIKSLKEPNFIVMTQLQKLNLSSNNIADIEDTTFCMLSELNELDLSSNTIPALSKHLFKNNTKLEVVILSNNNIQTIPSGIFSEMNITNFKINNNSISGMVDKDIFQGISESEFDLSNNNIEILGNDVFNSFGSELKYLNLSYNKIVNISRSAFTSAEYLITLDLSYNKLDKIDGYLKNLKETKYLNMSNNNISKLSKMSFEGPISLIELDLSFNFIKKIEDESFNELRNLETLILCNNPLAHSFTQHTLLGMISLKSIYLVNTGTTRYEKYAFSGMNDLKTVNSSSGGLMTIDYNCFNSTESIEILDLSHNLLDNFVVKNDSIPELKELYLENNKIQNITQNMFKGFTKLTKLVLARNHIIYVEDNSFSSLFKLVYLDLSYNDFLTMNATQIQNIPSLYSLSLKNVKTSYNFSSVEAASVKVLDMSFCEIVNIKERFIYTLKNITDLNLSSNKITQIDKHSFQTMPVLSSLDLSCNHIKYIQPGSFIRTNLLKSINLHDNELTSLQYGVFDGLQNLDVLNLSSNSLSSFEYNLLHNSPEVSIIVLDDNFIKSINLDSFDEKGIDQLSLGGNLINCDVFIDLKNHKYRYSFKVTAQTLDYHSENVNGITCSTLSKASVLYHTNNSLSNDTILPNITAAFNSLAIAMDMFQNTIEHVANSSLVNKELDSSKKEIEDVLATINKLINLYNNSQLLTNNLLQKMTESNVKPIQQVHFKDENTQVSNISTPIYVTLGCLVLLSALSIFLSYSYFKWKSRVLDANNFASNRHLTNEIEME